MVIRLYPSLDPDWDDPLGPFGPTIRRFHPETEEPEYDDDEEDDVEWYPPGDLKAA